MGGNTTTTHQQIIVRFQNFHERQTVWYARRNLDDRSLSITEKCVWIQSSIGVKLNPKSFDWQGPLMSKKQVYMNEDTLYVNNISYFLDTIGNLPSDLHPERLCKKVN